MNPRQQRKCKRPFLWYKLTAFSRVCSRKKCPCRESNPSLKIFSLTLSHWATRANLKTASQLSNYISLAYLRKISINKNHWENLLTFSDKGNSHLRARIIVAKVRSILIFFVGFAFSWKSYLHCCTKDWLLLLGCKPSDKLIPIVLW